MPTTDTADAGQRPFGWSDLLAPAALIALAWTIGQIAFAIWPQIDTLAQRGIHVAFAVSLAFAMQAGQAPSRAGRALWLVPALLALGPGAYIAWNAEFLMSERIPGLDPVATADYALGILLIVLLFVGGKLYLGWGLTIFAAAFVVYFFAGPYLPGVFAHRFSGLESFIDSQFLSQQGLFGVPVGVSVSTVFYFILFAAIYDVYGGGRLIIDLALTLTGRRTGGPAKAAVTSSGLLGSVSGSAVANVMSTGIFTIPLMRRSGYDLRFAGAVEAAASTGAQLVPPVMGAAAFIMADFLQMPYQTIVFAAILPAAAYFIALLIMVDLEARRRGARPERGAVETPMASVLSQRGHLLVPLMWLAYRIVAGYPVEGAAIEACAVTVVVGTLRKATRQNPIAVVEGLVVSAQRAVTVALPCALAGIAVAVISFTGLGTKFTSFMVTVAAGQVPLLLVLAMLSSLVLGAGMPTTSAYIMAAILLAPSLSSLGVEPLVAHFFIFYFAILSMVTPPVALAAYAAASITGASASETGWRAFSLSLPGFVIPFAAVVHPGLLLIGSPLDSVWAMTNVVMGFLAIAAATIGWLFRPLPAWSRGVFLAAGICSVLPGLVSTLACFAIIVALGAWAFQTRALQGRKAMG
ncbi:TRAP transporter permease [Jiella sonneratiae]|uniref:TRAP transporter fused permease subunit n=1 Tax=Jiella sonneratiae TaxID=2816856 RepID=A0ABS3J3N2_9HYPH|nr:TRAP transporter fused permease subunit [Jiella sonneratiae]MBO0903745.1 TRAP transporter fused permease subunit [Jiella sonneratiae]